MLVLFKFADNGPGSGGVGEFFPRRNVMLVTVSRGILSCLVMKSLNVVSGGLSGVRGCQ